MSTARTLYRSTLIAAALAAGTLGAAAVAEAHEQGWRGHGEGGWQAARAPRWYRHGYRHGDGDGERDGYRYGEGGWRYAPGWRDDDPPRAAVLYYPPAPLVRPWSAGVVIEVPAPW